MKKAFSLTELLLALGIVAVIATLMITTVIPKGDEKKYSTLANKAYLTLENAYGVQIMNDGGRDASDYGAENVLSHLINGNPPALLVYDNNAAETAAQLPNGMVLYNTSNSIYVDLDGIEGKTYTPLKSASNLTNKCDKADVLKFIINGSDISPDYDCGFAKEYFEYDDGLK